MDEGEVVLASTVGEVWVPYVFELSPCIVGVLALEPLASSLDLTMDLSLVPFPRTALGKWGG